MNKENTSKLWKMIQDAGDYLLGYSNKLKQNRFNRFQVVDKCSLYTFLLS